ncbi:MAG: adenine phosphoribosyltransferase [Coriobacteriaceae bacterium]|uniref:adenine phosphoribosyltransferase n=1 Tax=Olsenella TaxID=133925 RepID=UPI000FEE662E|nr:adenine phosphoribosyltransferase [Atopobium sp.]MCH3926868.1 adenine phosphoribosyltransferase [Atopobiaceae bacterium]MCI6262558.1 adenine phosphoribosyltransferase [Olsenella sp.]RRF95855.1 MAG: adenine phosphoribosyltransferase [Coriobacteriaceae bacterium]MCH4081229.1 adenine phosphoribosyltransferase [Atopobiaceae bacterium]
MSSVDYESLIVSIPDYPEPGVIFKDITPLFADAQGMAAAIDDIADHFINKGITKVVGAEARGFLVGAPVAYRLNAGFVPARKPGKLPREVYSQTYALEYGTDELQIHKDALTPDDRVLIVDDLVATGGTAVATAELVEKSGAKVAGFSFMLELTYLHPREEIAKKYDEEVFTLIQVQ